MNTIFKYVLGIDANQTHRLPQGATILRVGMDTAESPCFWAKVDTRNPLEEVYISVYGTGHPLPDNCGTYLGSLNQGAFIWHVFQDQTP